MDEKYVKIIKIFGIVASVAGMIASSWADSKENKLELQKLVDAHFNNIEKGE